MSRKREPTDPAYLECLARGVLFVALLALEERITKVRAAAKRAEAFKAKPARKRRRRAS